MRFFFIVVFIIISSCSGPHQKSTKYYETVIGHIVQTIISGNCNSKCVNSIVNSDLKYATYAQAIYVLDEVGKKLPNVFKGIKRELSIKIEEKYMREVFK